MKRHQCDQTCHPAIPSTATDLSRCRVQLLSDALTSLAKYHIIQYHD